MGCQDLLESGPGRGRVTSVSTTPGSLSDGKSTKVRAGLSGRIANGKTPKTDDLSCKSAFQPKPFVRLFSPLNLEFCSYTLFICLLFSLLNFKVCMSHSKSNRLDEN